MGDGELLHGPRDRIQERDRVRFHPSPRPAHPLNLKLKRLCLPVDHRLMHCQIRRSVFWYEHIVYGKTDSLLLIHLDHAQPGRVDGHQGPIRCHALVAARTRLQHQREQCFPFEQLFFRPLALGDVAHDGDEILPIVV